MTKTETMSNDDVRNYADDAFWGDQTSSVVREDAIPRVFDLEERTARFGEAVIDFAKRIPRSPLTDRLIGQLVGCGTSVGANYCEADDAVSRKEFSFAPAHAGRNHAKRNTSYAWWCAQFPT